MKTTEILYKGGKKAEIGEIRTWGKEQFKKEVDGWYYVSGPNKGKKMGGTKEAAPKKEAPKKTNFNDFGALAFKNGKTRAPASNKELMAEVKGLPREEMLEAFKAYARGWDTANLAAPLSELKPVEAPKKVINPIMQVTKDEQKVLEYLTMELTEGRPVKIKNPVEHRAAEILISQGLARSTAKKNYGRIAEIILVNPEEKIEALVAKEQPTELKVPHVYTSSLKTVDLSKKEFVGVKSNTPSTASDSSGREVNLSLSGTGKPSTFIKKYKTNTNLIGEVGFGKASQKQQEALNSYLNSADILLESMEIKFKEPIDFICQTLNSTSKTSATFAPYKKYGIRDRIDINKSVSAAKSIMHEIGHAIDYASSEADTFMMSRFSEMKNNKDPIFTKMQEILQAAPFYTERRDKSYLDRPTEVFARAFEVYSFVKAEALVKKGVIPSEFLNTFNPDFLKSADPIAKVSYLERLKLFEALPEENKIKANSINKQMQELRDINIKIIAEYNSDSSVRGSIERASLRTEAVKNSKKINKLQQEANQETFEALRNYKNLTEGTNDSERVTKVKAEVTLLMDEFFSKNDIKKALQNLSFNLRKSESSSYYVAVVALNQLGQVLLGKRKEYGIITTPCGGNSNNEIPQEVAVRECFEEAGLLINPTNLVSLGVKKAPNGKPVHCFAYYTDQTSFTVKNDPDQEVPEWNWISPENFPKSIYSEKNRNRLETINEARMVIMGIKKSNTLEKKMPTNTVIKSLKALLSKSVTQMGSEIGAPDINTSEFAQENSLVNQKHLKDFQDTFGDMEQNAPALFLKMPKGEIHLSKVDHGIYSGVFRVSESVDGALLQDNLNVRIERQTLPSLVSFLTAKELLPIITPEPIEVAPEVKPETTNTDERSILMEVIKKLLSN